MELRGPCALYLQDFNKHCFIQYHVGVQPTLLLCLCIAVIKNQAAPVNVWWCCLSMHSPGVVISFYCSQECEPHPGNGVVWDTVVMPG